MLKHERIAKYNRARYPKYYFYRRIPAMHENIVKYGLGAAVIITALENIGCIGNGIAGPPPIPPGMVTENEAREVVDSVFSANGINLTEDVILKIETAPGDSVELSVDGFNDSLKTGYEYISIEDSIRDNDEYTPEVISRLNELTAQDGPYIKTIEPVYKDDDYKKHLETVVGEFIDTLKARGVI
ncbi:MAG: hypothetical protein CVT49_10180 [candidate division Zixibacteria bacterium HGW-Zixibacteria-1]|nr:MAG: hypothetical protein CVT49_10180 [candidate division Zixibacteria bacterium HGW-Zixibacteria-1]